MADLIDLLPIPYDIRVPRKADTTLQVAFTNASGVAEDLTSDTITLIVADDYGGTTQFTKEVTEFSAPLTGIALIVLAAADLDDGKTSGVTTWVYTIWRTHGGRNIAWFSGSFEIRPVVALPA